MVELDNASPGLVGESINEHSFNMLCGNMAGHDFVKVVVDKPNKTIHFINNNRYKFHAHYIGENLTGESWERLQAHIDDFNRSVYHAPDRRFYLGIIARHRRPNKMFFTLETVEVDTMSLEMLLYFYDFVRTKVDQSFELLLKPANHSQENQVQTIDPTRLPRIFNFEVFSSEDYIVLNPGTAKGRLRIFRSEKEYADAFNSLSWYDIVVMDRVPDDIPRVSGIINSQHTTPLSHTNVLATGWKIPNCIQLGIIDELSGLHLNNEWVQFEVSTKLPRIKVERCEKPTDILERPTFSHMRVKLEEPETRNTPICELDSLRMSDRFRYGTKAANLGELRYVLENGSERAIGFYRVKRPPRDNLLPYLATLLGVPDTAHLSKAAWDFLRKTIKIPRGISLPFAMQVEFLESSPKIQQTIGKLKMALELNVKAVDPLCMQLQQFIRQTRLSDRMCEAIDNQIANYLGGVSSFVVRSSSNAEDLENFSAAGIYESINHVSTPENIFESIKEVWASLVSPRSVRLRHEVGISLDDCYMGVIVQEEVESDMGGVLVTVNPASPQDDFRNVYINVSGTSVVNIVQGQELPYQYLYNTVEGGGRTLSIGSARSDLSDEKKQTLQKLSLAGRLLQSHYSRDYTFKQPIDVEWVTSGPDLFILQVRPYAVSGSR